MMERPSFVSEDHEYGARFSWYFTKPGEMVPAYRGESATPKHFKPKDSPYYSTREECVEALNNYLVGRKVVDETFTVEEEKGWFYKDDVWHAAWITGRSLQSFPQLQ